MMQKGEWEEQKSQRIGEDFNKSVNEWINTLKRTHKIQESQTGEDSGFSPSQNNS